jgi:uncharacterized membrane protein
MINVQHSVVINRPVEEVFDFVSNVENIVRWQTGALECSPISQGPSVVGAKSRYVREVLGNRVEAITEVTEYDPNRKIGFKTDVPLPIEGSYSFEIVEGGARFTFALQAEPTGMFKLAEGMITRTVQKQIEDDCNKLKDVLESRVEGASTLL